MSPTPAAGWYPDPERDEQGLIRYWDGSKWSEQTRERPEQPSPEVAADEDEARPPRPIRRRRVQPLRRRPPFNLRRDRPISPVHRRPGR